MISLESACVLKAPQLCRNWMSYITHVEIISWTCAGKEVGIKQLREPFACEVTYFAFVVNIWRT